MFYIEKDNKIVLFDEDRQKLLDTLDFMPQYRDLAIKEVQESYTILDFELMTIDEAEQKLKEKETERISKLCLTAADVERALYKAFGKDFDDIVETVTQLQPEGLDIKALKIELKANNFYRGNPYVAAIGNILGITSKQLNEFFETNDYTKLMPESEE